MSSTVVPPSDEVSCFFSPPPKRFPIPSAVFWRLTLSLMLIEDCFVNQSAGDGAAVKALVSKDNSEAVSSTTTDNSDGPVMRLKYLAANGNGVFWCLDDPVHTLSCLCLA